LNLDFYLDKKEKKNSIKEVCITRVVLDAYLVVMHLNNTCK